MKLPFNLNLNKSNMPISLLTKIILGIIAVIVAYLIIKFFMNTYESFETSTTGTTTVNLYTMVGCSHCDKFKPDWDKLTSTYPNGTKLKDGNTVAYNKYSTDTDAERINADGITGFPTITIQKPGEKTATQYGGPRTMEGLWNFVNIDPKEIEKKQQN